eukprot:8910-Heterococcus_DN1.PRE.3
MACTTHVKVAVPSVDGATIHCKRKVWIAVCSRPLLYAVLMLCTARTRTGNGIQDWLRSGQDPYSAAAARRSIAAVERLKDSNCVHEANRSVIKSQKKERGTECGPMLSKAVLTSRTHAQSNPSQRSSAVQHVQMISCTVIPLSSGQIADSVVEALLGLLVLGPAATPYLLCKSYVIMYKHQWHAQKCLE